MILRIIQVFIAALGIVQGGMLIRIWAKTKETISNGTKALFWVMGVIINFFDYLGIGSIAPSMAIYKLTKTVKDEELIGTLVTGCVVPVAVEALASLQVIDVEVATVVTAYVTGAIGAFLGGRVGSKLNENTLRKVMGIALIIAGTLMLLSMFGLMPLGGEEIGLHGAKLVIMGIGTFVLGFLQANGVGCYAPTMVLVYMLGMSPLVSFPIMMGLGTIAVGFGSFPYFESGRFNKQASLAFAFGGIPGVLLAVFVVTSLPLTALRWIVVVVVFYTAITFLRQAFGKNANNEAANA